MEEFVSDSSHHGKSDMIPKDEPHHSSIEDLKDNTRATHSSIGEIFECIPGSILEEIEKGDCENSSNVEFEYCKKDYLNQNNVSSDSALIFADEYGEEYEAETGIDRAVENREGTLHEKSELEPRCFPHVAEDNFMRNLNECAEKQLEGDLNANETSKCIKNEMLQLMDTLYSDLVIYSKLQDSKRNAHYSKYIREMKVNDSAPMSMNENLYNNLTKAISRNTLKGGKSDSNDGHGNLIRVLEDAIERKARMIGMKDKSESEIQIHSISPPSNEHQEGVEEDCETKLPQPIEILSHTLEDRKNSSFKSTKSDLVRCGICMDEDFTEQGALPCCKHIFCFQCIEQWSKKVNTCPFCLQRFTSITRQTYCQGQNHIPEIIEIVTVNTVNQTATQTPAHPVIDTIVHWVQEEASPIARIGPYPGWLRYSLLFFSLLHLMFGIAIYFSYIIGIILVSSYASSHSGSISQFIVATYLLLGFFICAGGLAEISFSYQFLRSSFRRSPRQLIYNIFGLLAYIIAWIFIFIVIIAFCFLIFGGIYAWIATIAVGAGVVLKIFITSIPCLMYIFVIFPHRRNVVQVLI